MKFFIDTANLDQIKEANDLGILDGVTTNPSLMAKEGITGKDNILKHYATIAEIVDGDVSAEVISTDFAGMVEEAKVLAEIADNIVVKIPMIYEGVKGLELVHRAWDTDQLYPGLSAGLKLCWRQKRVLPMYPPSLVGLTILTGKVVDLIAEIAELYAVQGFETEILAASIRYVHSILCNRRWQEQMW